MRWLLPCIPSSTRRIQSWRYWSRTRHRGRKAMKLTTNCQLYGEKIWRFRKCKSLCFLPKIVNKILKKTSVIPENPKKYPPSTRSSLVVYKVIGDVSIWHTEAQSSLASFGSYEYLQIIYIWSFNVRLHGLISRQNL